MWAETRLVGERGIEMKKESNLLQLLRVADPETYEKMKAVIKPCSDCQEWDCDGCKHKAARNFLEEEDGREDF